MEEYFNSKENALLEYMNTHYKKTLEVKFRIPNNVYENIGIENGEELGKILMALSIRNYVFLNPIKEIHTLWTSEITLTEKALNKFNKGN